MIPERSNQLKIDGWKMKFLLMAHLVRCFPSVSGRLVFKKKLYQPTTLQTNQNASTLESPPPQKKKKRDGWFPFSYKSNLSIPTTHPNYQLPRLQPPPPRESCLQSLSSLAKKSAASSRNHLKRRRTPKRHPPPMRTLGLKRVLFFVF